MEWSCCKDDVCKNCGKKLAECDTQTCGWHFDLPKEAK